MTYTNAQKLAAVLNKWAAPLVSSLVDGSMSKLPVIASIEASLKQFGLVSPQWSLLKELSPIMGDATSLIIEPILANYLGNVPDDSIPRIAHKFVDNAIERGGDVVVMDGNVTFTQNDMRELKRYLNYNLPVGEEHGYEVIDKTDEAI